MRSDAHNYREPDVAIVRREAVDRDFLPASAVGGHVIMPNLAADLQERVIAA